MHGQVLARWKMTTMLEDLDLADDLALISSTFGQIQRKIDCLNRNGKGTGLKISEENQSDEEQRKQQQRSCNRWAGSRECGQL